MPTKTSSLEDFAGAQVVPNTVSLDSFHAGEDALDESARAMTGPTAMARSANTVVSKLGDMFLGLPADVAGVAANEGGRLMAKLRGVVEGKAPTQAQVSEEGGKYEELLKLPAWFKSPATWAMNKLGAGPGGAPSEDLISQHLDSIATRVDKSTGGRLDADTVRLRLREAMDLGGLAGVKAVTERLLTGKAVPAPSASLPPEAEPIPAARRLNGYADLKSFSEAQPAQRALPRPAIEGEATRVPDEDTPMLTQKGAADPKLLAAIAAGGGLGMWAIANPEAAKDALAGGMLVGGAIKAKGGMWHPEAVERLGGAMDTFVEPRNPRSATEFNLQNRRMISGYLNKHAGTATDPLKGVEIPFGEGTKRWEELTDKAIQNAPAKYYSDIKAGSLEEPVYTVGERLNQSVKTESPLETAKRQDANTALKSYLSHVGDYLREHVPPEKLSQYDLVRAVKETKKWDKELAKNMEKAQLDNTKGSPVYKDYGDGMRWVQLTKPGQFARESDAMGHSVRGYEPPRAPQEGAFAGQPNHPDWVPASGDSGHPSYGLGGWEAIKRGDAKVYSLRNKEGKSHVTVEVGSGYPNQLPDRITQIKGKQNRAPAAEYLPYVQDFVKGGKWGEVGDLQGTGLTDLTHAAEGSATLATKAAEAQRFFGKQYVTHEAWDEYRKGNRTDNLRQRGSIDPKLLARMAAMAVGAAVGAYASEQHPVIGAIVGGLGAGALTKLSPRAAAAAVKSAFAADPRIRINDIADKWEGQVAKAGRAVWRQQMDVVDAAPKAADRVALTKAIQSGGPVPPGLAKAAAKAKEFFSAMGKQGQESGVLKDLIDNYVTNLWDLTGANKTKWEEILNKAGGPAMSPESKFALKRRFANLEAGKAAGLVPRTEDIAEIMGIYGNSLSRSIANRAFVEALKAERGLAGERLVMPSAAAPHSYVSIDHPVLTGRRVHPDIAPSLKFIFDNQDSGVVMNGLSALNTAIKRSAVSFSLFHAKALTDALIGAASNPLRAAKIVTSSAFGTNQYLKMLRRGGEGDIVDKALEHGLKFTFERGRLADEDVGGSFYSGLKTAQKGLDSLIPGLGLPLKGLTKLNHYADTFMWERLHAGMKLSIFAEKLEALQQAGVEEKAAGKAAASFANDTFGGLNWRRIAEAAHTKWGRDIALSAYSPTGRRWLQLLLFAPDWTLSTTRAALKAFGQLAGYEKGTGVKGLINPKTVTDLHRQYLIRSALYYALVGDGINYTLSGHHIWDNKDWSVIELGDGRTMQWSKHTMEPVHWITKGGQQALNKLGFIPKELANQALGSEYLSTHTAPPMDKSLSGRAMHVLKSVEPIAGQQTFGTSATPGSALSGALGVPIYGKTYAERADAKAAAKEKARETRRNRQFNPDYDPSDPDSKRYLRGSADTGDSSFAKKMEGMSAREAYRQQEREDLMKRAYAKFGKKGVQSFLAEEEQAEIRKATPRRRLREVM